MSVWDGAYCGSSDDAVPSCCGKSSDDECDDTHYRPLSSVSPSRVEPRHRQSNSDTGRSRECNDVSLHDGAAGTNGEPVEPPSVPSPAKGSVIRANNESANGCGCGGGYSYLLTERKDALEWFRALKDDWDQKASLRAIKLIPIRPFVSLLVDDATATNGNWTTDTSTDTTVVAAAADDTVAPVADYRYSLPSIATDESSRNRGEDRSDKSVRNPHKTDQTYSLGDVQSHPDNAVELVAVAVAAAAVVMTNDVTANTITLVASSNNTTIGEITDGANGPTEEAADCIDLVAPIVVESASPRPEAGAFFRHAHDGTTGVESDDIAAAVAAAVDTSNTISDRLSRRDPNEILGGVLDADSGLEAKNDATTQTVVPVATTQTVVPVESFSNGAETASDIANASDADATYYEQVPENLSLALATTDCPPLSTGATELVWNATDDSAERVVADPYTYDCLDAVPSTSVTDGTKEIAHESSLSGNAAPPLDIHATNDAIEIKISHLDSVRTDDLLEMSVEKTSALVDATAVNRTSRTDSCLAVGETTEVTVEAHLETTGCEVETTHMLRWGETTSAITSTTDDAIEPPEIVGDSQACSCANETGEALSIPKEETAPVLVSADAKDLIRIQSHPAAFATTINSNNDESDESLLVSSEIDCNDRIGEKDDTVDANTDVHQVGPAHDIETTKATPSADEAVDTAGTSTETTGFTIDHVTVTQVQLVTRDEYTEPAVEPQSILRDPATSPVESTSKTVSGIDLSCIPHTVSACSVVKTESTPPPRVTTDPSTVASIQSVFEQGRNEQPDAPISSIPLFLTMGLHHSTVDGPNLQLDPNIQIDTPHIVNSGTECKSRKDLESTILTSGVENSSDSSVEPVLRVKMVSESMDVFTASKSISESTMVAANTDDFLRDLPILNVTPSRPSLEETVSLLTPSRDEVSVFNIGLVSTSDVVAVSPLVTVKPWPHQQSSLIVPAEKRALPEIKVPKSVTDALAGLSPRKYAENILSMLDESTSDSNCSEAGNRSLLTCDSSVAEQIESLHRELESSHEQLRLTRLKLLEQQSLLSSRRAGQIGVAIPIYSRSLTPSPQCIGPTTSQSARNTESGLRCSLNDSIVLSDLNSGLIVQTAQVAGDNVTSCVDVAPIDTVRRSQELSISIPVDAVDSTNEENKRSPGVHYDYNDALSMRLPKKCGNPPSNTRNIQYDANVSAFDSGLESPVVRGVKPLVEKFEALSTIWKVQSPKRFGRKDVSRPES